MRRAIEKGIFRKTPNGECIEGLPFSADSPEGLIRFAMTKVIDNKILAELRQNARISITSLAQKVGRSRTAVQARVDRLEQDGCIRHYTIEESNHLKADDIGAVVMIAVKERSKSQEVFSLLRGIRQVVGCFGVAGKYDFVVFLSRMENHELHEILESIYLLEIVRETETTLTLNKEF